MSRGREDGVGVIGDVNMLTPFMRAKLGKIFADGYAKGNEVEEFTKAGYIELTFKGSGGQGQEYKITPKGDAILRASDIFWETVWEKFPNETENRKMLLTPKNYHVLDTLCRTENGLTTRDLIDKLSGIIVEGKEYDKEFVSSLVDGMQRKGLVEKNNETGCWDITKFGEVILLASYEFYEQLLENGFYENGTEDLYEDVPISARDTFVEDRLNAAAE